MPQFSNKSSRRPGMPDPESVVIKRTLTPPLRPGVSAAESAATTYCILKTDETDAYDPPPQPKKQRR